MPNQPGNFSRLEVGTWVAVAFKPGWVAESAIACEIEGTDAWSVTVAQLYQNRFDLDTRIVVMVRLHRLLVQIGALNVAIQGAGVM
jgi:hypothetical protein